MLDKETPEDMYRRLKALCVTMVDLGATYVDDQWIKRKFVQALLPYEEVKLNSIKGREGYRTMTSNGVLSEIIAMTIAKKNADDALSRSQGVHKVNLALKAKVVEQEEEEDVEWCPEETKYDYHEHMDLAAKAFWGKNFKSRDNIRSYPSGQRPNGPRARTCYNCGDNTHFVAECPYEKREDNGGHLIPKDKSKPSPYKKFGNKNFPNKKVPTRVLVVQEYYMSEDEKEEEDEVV
jgi:hypothetical protein